MALLSELPPLARELKSKSENVVYGDIWTRAHTSDLSPMPQLGKSLDPGEENKRSSQKKNEASIASRKAEAAKAQNKTKLIVFEVPKEPYSGSPFKVEPISSPKIEQSALSTVIGHVAKVDVKIFIPSSGSKKPLEFKVTPTTTFGQLITLTVKKWNEAPGVAKKLPEEIEAFIVRIATEDGRLEEMFPVEVSLKQPVDKWLNQPFLLMENPRHAKKDKPQDEKDTAADQKVVIKAYLPKGDYHTLIFEKSTKMSKVLKAFCEKRSLLPNDYTLQSVSDPPSYINRDMKISDLKDYSVRMVPKSDMTITMDSDEVEIFWYDSLAQAFKTYSVTFIKNKGGPFGGKQDRILGIDGERITQTVVKKKGTNKQLPPNSIREVTDAFVHEDKPSFFTIEFREKPHLYEAVTSGVAREIVGKLQHLLSIAQRQAK